MVDADSIRIFLIRWMIEAGDQIEFAVKEFDVDMAQVADLLEGRIRRLRTS